MLAVNCDESEVETYRSTGRRPYRLSEEEAEVVGGYPVLMVDSRLSDDDVKQFIEDF